MDSRPPLLKPTIRSVVNHFRVLNPLLLISFYSAFGLAENFGVTSLNPICESAFEGHTIGDLDKYPGGCCLLELGQERCNLNKIDIDKVERTIFRSKIPDASLQSCPDSLISVTAPIFAWSAESNEILSVVQKEEQVQLLEQIFCDEEVCQTMESCREVFDSVSMDVADAESPDRVRSLKVFVAVRCDCVKSQDDFKPRHDRVKRTVYLANSTMNRFIMSAVNQVLTGTNQMTPASATESPLVVLERMPVVGSSIASGSLNVGNIMVTSSSVERQVNAVGQDVDSGVANYFGGRTGYSGNGYSYPFNPLAPPQHEIKKFKGIVRYYNKCVGSSLRTHVEAPCIFPFIYQGQVHNACTTTLDSQPWCATKVDSNGHLVSSDWGYCTADCPLEHQACKTIQGGPIVNVFCRFPFRYKGVQYFTCSTEDDTQPWCATQVDTHGDFIQGQWGRCECDSLNTFTNRSNQGYSYDSGTRQSDGSFREIDPNQYYNDQTTSRTSTILTTASTMSTTTPPLNFDDTTTTVSTTTKRTSSSLSTTTSTSTRSSMTSTTENDNYNPKTSTSTILTTASTMSITTPPLNFDDTTTTKRTSSSSLSTTTSTVSTSSSTRSTTTENDYYNPKTSTSTVLTTSSTMSPTTPPLNFDDTTTTPSTTTKRTSTSSLNTNTSTRSTTTEYDNYYNPKTSTSTVLTTASTMSPTTPPLNFDDTTTTKRTSTSSLSTTTSTISTSTSTRSTTTSTTEYDNYYHKTSTSTSSSSTSKSTTLNDFYPPPRPATTSRSTTLATTSTTFEYSNDMYGNKYVAKPTTKNPESSSTRNPYNSSDKPVDNISLSIFNGRQSAGLSHLPVDGTIATFIPKNFKDPVLEALIRSGVIKLAS